MRSAFPLLIRLSFATKTASELPCSKAVPVVRYWGDFWRVLQPDCGGFVVMAQILLLERSSKNQRWLGIGVLALGLSCLFSALPLASAQSRGKSTSYNPHPQSSHPPNFSAKSYKSAGATHNLDTHPHSGVAPITLPKSSGSATSSLASHERELNQLEHSSSLQAGHGQSVHAVSATKAPTRHSSEHSAPINFTHKEAQTARPVQRPSSH